MSPILLLKGLGCSLERILELVVAVLLTHLIERLHHMLVPGTSAGREFAALATALALTTLKSHSTGCHFVSTYTRDFCRSYLQKN
jgi:hypothetical protein